MAERLMIKGLSHKRMNYSDECFFQDIDAHGGWPTGYKYVGFVHSDEREAGFTNSRTNTGWWTVVASADDYYMWKLSPEALQRVIDSALSASSIVFNKNQIRIRNSMGMQAALAQKETP